MRLGNDIARCDGNGSACCAECLRRIADRPEPHWMLPAEASGDACEFLIAEGEDGR